MFCRNVLHNLIYMKVLQKCSSIIWQECSIFNILPQSQSDIFLNPIILINLANCILPIPFVNISAIISPLLQGFNSILFIVTISLIQWNLISKCFAWPWCWGFFVIEIIDWLYTEMKFFMHYQKSVHGIFCMFWRINFFRKILFLSLWTEKGQKVTFLIFCMKFQKHKGLKLTHDFLGGKI